MSIGLRLKRVVLWYQKCSAIVKYHSFFPLHLRCLSTILKFLQRFSEINFLSFIFGYTFRIIFASNKVFYFSQIKERKIWFYLNQNIRFFISKTLNFLFRKKRCCLKRAIPEFPIFPKSTCLLLAIFLKFIFNQKGKRGFIWSKTFHFLFQKHSKFFSEKRVLP